MMPIPYLGAATPLGLFYALGIKFKFTKSQRFVVLATSLLVVLTFFANKQSSTPLSYEEMKRLAVLVCAASTSIFFYSALRTESSSLKFQNQSLLYLGLGQLLASRIFWELPDTLRYSNYSWYKFAGANALILVAIQLYMISRYANSNRVWIFLGICLTSYSLSQSAKSVAFFTMFIFLLRFSICRSPKLLEKFASNISLSRTRIVKIIGINVLFLLVIRWILGTGLLGERLATLVNQYGSGIVSSINNARPEFQYSLKILSQQPFMGYGTISNPLDNIDIQIDTSNILAFTEQRFLISRILNEGFNLHSWAFDLVVRAGFLCFIPILIYLFQLLKCLTSIDLIRSYPGLIYIVMVSVIDLFFSPYSWFVSSQIAFTFLAIYLRYMMNSRKEIN